MVHKKVRLPKAIIKVLRDLRDSHITPRPIPKLVTACLKQTRGVGCLNLAPTPRHESERIDLWLEPEFADLSSAEIKARVAHALIGIQSRLIPQQIEINRGEYQF